jgi:hypothetical protein
LDKAALVNLLISRIPKNLAEDILTEFLQIRQDVATATLGRASPGKFVETLVQILQHLESGHYDQQPNVDAYLRGLESKAVPMEDGLRVCAARVGRAMYTFRNKRNILHKGAVDPNAYDLQFLYGASQWILAELVRQTTGQDMAEAGALVAQIQAPIGAIVEDFADKAVVLHKLATPDEVLVLLRHKYPETLSRDEITYSLDRRNADTVRKALVDLWKDKSIEQLADKRYKLTKKGLAEAIRIVQSVLES